MARNVLAEAEGESATQGDARNPVTIGSGSGTDKAAQVLAGYMRSAAASLAGTSLDTLSSGAIVWPMLAPELSNGSDDRSKTARPPRSD